jgi:hypothetical protein
MDRMIPLMSAANEKGSRRKLKDISLQFCIDHPGNYVLLKNKRGHVHRALLKPRNSLQPLSNAGQSFIEPLPEVGARVWALRSTKSSK